MGKIKLNSSVIQTYFDALIYDEIKYAIENLHLYQNFRIRFFEFDKWCDEMNIDRELTDLELKRYNDIYNETPLLTWNLTNLGHSSYKISYISGKEKSAELDGQLSISPPSPVKLYCHNCKEVEPFNYIREDIVLNSDIDGENYEEVPLTQLYELVYQCQSCRGLPEVFLIQRKGVKISIHGRSPIEQFPVNKTIPKNQIKYFSDSRIAFNSGQILAAIFLMRTFIEQYIRDKVKNFDSREIDKLFDQYSGNLPPDFNSRFPSLKSVYDRLSEDIHSATGSEETYSQAKVDIENHFEALRLFEKHKLITW